jgi:hypothetical protein
MDLGRYTSSYWMKLMNDILVLRSCWDISAKCVFRFAIQVFNLRHYDQFLVVKDLRQIIIFVTINTDKEVRPISSMVAFYV